MHVKLSYTIEEEDILKEAANLLSLRGPTLQQVVEDYQSIQRELTQEDDPPNLSRVEEYLLSLRKGLRGLDLRAAEVGGIVREYEAHRRQGPPSPLSSPPTLPEAIVPEDEE